MLIYLINWLLSNHLSKTIKKFIELNRYDLFIFLESTTLLTESHTFFSVSDTPVSVSFSFSQFRKKNPVLWENEIDKTVYDNQFS